MVKRLVGAMLPWLVLGCAQMEKQAGQPISESQQAVTIHELAPPVASKQAHPMVVHNHSRIDDYYWMRDDARTDPAVINHLNAENAYTQSQLAHTQSLQDRLFDEITNRMKKDDSSVPVKYINYYYYSRYEGDKEYPIYARKRGTLDAQEEVLLDGNQMAEGHDYFAIGDYAVSTNERYLAYSTDTLSRRVYTIELIDLASGERLPDVLHQTTGQVFWANDNKTLFYIKKDLQTLLGYQVYRHELGQDQSSDVLVYEEKDKSFFTWLGKTKDDSTLYIMHGSTVTQGASILSADTPTQEFSLLAPLEANHEYSFARLGDWFYILTNWQAKNFRLMKVPVSLASNKHNWQEVVPHNENVLLQKFDVFERFLVLSEKEAGQTRIRIRNIKDGRSHLVAFDDPVYVASLASNTEVNTDFVRIKYSSLTTPVSIYDYNMSDRTKTLKKQEQVLGDFDAHNYASERIFVEARDGAKVPVSIVYRKDSFSQDGTNPLYLYGYGSYGHSIEPYFSGARLSLLDRGFVFAIAHIRGSQTLGRAWYEDGKLNNKLNTFTDFIDVTKGLVAKKYAAKNKVFAAGGSAGGLLIGAVINMAPQLYLGVGAHVPFVDVVTTMLDESIPLTTNEYDEWGNPNEQAAYEYMLSYSPYDNVSAQNYPNILVTTGLHDSQVQYFEPAKWVAKLRELKTDNNRLVFKVNMEAGHGGASGRFRRNKERALEYAFFMDLIDIKQ